MKKTGATFFLAAYLGAQAMMPGYADARSTMQEKQRSISDDNYLEMILLKPELNEKDLPQLKNKVSENSTIKDGVACTGDWYKSGDYFIAKTVCNGKNLAYYFFGLDNDKKKYQFKAGFYNSTGEKFERTYSMDDRPIPDWIKK